MSTLKPLAISGALVGGSVLSYYSYLTYTNQVYFLEQKQNDEQYKDTTRETNEYFGLSWGYKADFLVKEQIDSGDIFFIKYECDECLSLGQMIRCNFLQTFKQDQEYDSIGFAFRDSEGLFVVSNQFGVTKIMEYADFLSQPFLSELSMRKLISKNGSTDSRVFFRLLKGHFRSLQKLGEIKESEIDFAYNLVHQTEILAQKVQDQQIRPQIADYDQASPFFLKPRFKFDNKLIIRSGTNKQLNSSNLFTSTSQFN